MRISYGAAALAAVMSAAVLLDAEPTLADARPLTCSTFGQTFTFSDETGFAARLVSGDMATLRLNSGPNINVSANGIQTITPGQTITLPVGSYNLIMDLASTGTASVTLACSTGGSSSTNNQPVNNAQAATSNGQNTLQNLNDWTTKGVMGSFGLIGDTGTAQAPGRLRQQLTARARVETLRQQEQELAEELAEKPGDTGLTARLADLRHDLQYARTSADIMSSRALSFIDRPTPLSPGERTALTEPMQARNAISRKAAAPADEATAVHDGPVGLKTQQSAAAPPALSFGSRDLIEMCETEVGQYNPAREILGRKWNVWAEARVTLANDTLGQSNAFGFVGSAGLDYKVTPWMALGLSLGGESYETKFGFNGVRLGSVGVSAVPYAGFKLDDKIFASLFVGVTQINYNSNPQLGATANFTATRFFFGGSLFGVWHEGPWRIQPTLAASYGTEAQQGYTDSLGNAVAGQTVNYGRLSAGPEIGYAFKTPDATVEPYVTGRANLDFSSSNATLLQGQSVVLRPGTQGSGSAGVGVDARFASGFYLRVQGSYDSIGVTGLDVWSGLLRGGYTF